MPMMIVMIPPIIMTVVRIIPTMVCIPVPYVYPVIVVGIIIKDVICCGIYVDCVTVIVYKPVIYSTAILQVPIEIG